MSGFRKLFLMGLGLVAALSWVVPADANIIGNKLPSDALVNFNDTNVDRILDASGNVVVTQPGTATVLDVGWYVESIYRIDFIDGTATATLAGLPNYELTVHSKVKVTAINDAPTIQGVNRVNYSFTNGFDSQTAIKFYENPDKTAGGKYDERPASGTAIAAVDSNDLLFTAGILSNDDFWTAASVPADWSKFKDFTASALFGGTFQLGLSLVSNPGHFPILTDKQVVGATGKLHNLAGAGSFLGIKGRTFEQDPVHGDWAAGSRAEFTLHTIPEPTSVVLWGLMISGLAFIGWRRRKQG